ncbi:radical SAM protein [Streptomyces sp. NPDC051561]|uniref:radical SAM protein n=1 Tax=Streptomyces sp. NPDC051561 TaxID=3365658 RepID=UPI00378972ED
MTAQLLEATPKEASGIEFLSLDLTRKCQLSCTHCFNGSGPDGDHGSMTREQWMGIIDQAAAAGTTKVQFFGGEPTTHPDYAFLTRRALSSGMLVETFTNLVHVTSEMWEIFSHPASNLATSYYSDQAEEHNALTRRPTHRHTRSNIIKAVERGIPIRVGIIDTGVPGAAERAHQELTALGVTQIRTDRIRAIGRAGDTLGIPTVREGALCGRCGDKKAAISPDGNVTPCVMATWKTVGNVKEEPLADILRGTAMAEATAHIQGITGRNDGCSPDDECNPGTPTSSCTPRS